MSEQIPTEDSLYLFIFEKVKTKLGNPKGHLRMTLEEVSKDKSTVLVKVWQKKKLILEEAFPIQELLDDYKNRRKEVVVPTPKSEHEFSVLRNSSDSANQFRIKPMEAQLPLKSLEEYQALERKVDRLIPVDVVIHQHLYDYFLSNWDFSLEVEEGGFLIGEVFKNKENQNRHIVEIHHAVPAQHTGASFGHLTFTGDTFSAIKRELRENYPHLQLLGWYHTHLFAAKEEMGLSEVDYDLHFSTFKQPWQLAGLINQGQDKKRLLRFYVKSARKLAMEQCSQWVTS